MGKAHVTAIIQALQETIENLSVNGCSARSKITNPTVDSQYVQALEDDYGDEIDTIIENIPDDPPVPAGPSVFVLLPKSPADSFGGYNTVVEACDLDGNYIPYSRVENFITGNSSMICNCFNNSSTYGFVDTDVSVSSCITNNSGNVAWKSTRYYQNSWCAFCAFISDPTGVTVIDIFESQAPYRCFKSFYYDGKYFVLDKIQKQWVSDLSTLGYQTTPIDGVVYPFGAFCLTEISFSGYVSKYAKTWDNQYIGCNDGLGYSCVGAYRVNGTSATSQFSFIRENNSTSLYLKNESSSAYIYSAKFATQSKLPSVDKFYAKTLSGSSTAQSVTLQPNVISRWLYETIAQSSYMGFTPAVMNVSDGTNVIARKGVSALFDNTDGGQGTYSSYCISIRNDTGAALTCTYARVALCMSNLITVSVVNVYNSSNDAYNAFKYNDGTTDYYYVLDGTQADWTNDLSSIGYSLTKNLPTVQNVQCWFNQNQGSASVPTSFTRLVYDANNNRIPYSASLLYCVFFVEAWETPDGTFDVVKSTNDNIAISRSNGTNSTTVYTVFYASCSDKTATIIDVYDSQNNVFKAFKYTLDGVDYYRVMEWQNTHPDWVTDLSSIGYHLPVQLPSVTTINVSLSALGQSKSLANDETSALYNSSAGYSQVLYDTSKVYATVYMSASAIWHSGFPLENGYGVVTVRNKTGSTMTIYGGIIAQCDNVTASVVTVYNSSNTAYNAFKYTTNGTDYYYVLDGTQADWISDLSSIGYSLTKSLPTVTQLRNSVQYTGHQWNAGDSQRLVDSGGSTIPYNSSVTYGFRQWLKFTTTEHSPGQIINDSGYVAAKNTGSLAVSGVYWVDYAKCSDATSVVVTVYNASNVAYDAFKFTLEGTDYYWVLDETQTGWTDDLSSIGYSLTPALPTVYESINYYFNKSASGNYYFADNETKDLFSSSGYKISYNDTFSYAVVVCKDTSTNEVRIGIPVVKDDVYLALRNETGAAISLSYASISTCSSSDANVVTVYDSNNAAFNAFKYTASGTDYYYVLDEVQNDWTDDLSSIGYSLTPFEYKAYLDNQNKTITWNGWFPLYANGQKTATIPYDSGKTYTFVAAYALDGTKVNTSGHTIIIGRPDSSYSILFIIDQTSSFTAYRIEYTVS